MFRGSKYQLFVLVLSAALCQLGTGWAMTVESNQPFAELNLRYPENSTQLTIPVNSSQSASYGWRAHQSIKVRAYVERAGGQRVHLQDERGRSEWTLDLDGERQGILHVTPAKDSFGGRIYVTGNGKEIQEGGSFLSQPLVLEKVLEHRFPDGARIKVHYTDQILEHAGEEPTFPGDVLDAAVMAYQTITEFLGFGAEGYSFAKPDLAYAYDADRTIDIYLGSSEGPGAFMGKGFDNIAFKDAPCFDTLKISETRYEAIILLPANYRQFIRNWEKINPSPLGKRTVEVDLRGTLIHEMLHVIIFYYNKNLDRESRDTTGVGGSHKTDWYVEGLARYIETFAGARHDFYSQGFKQTLPDKIRFSRGGSNYFMRYPDQVFTELRYENALFWRHLDHRYGMEMIERISREFRGGGDLEAKLVAALGKPFTEIIEDYAAAIYEKDFGLKDDAGYLKDVAATHLTWRGGSLRIRDGYGQERALGTRCETDWIGGWEEFAARFEEPSVAGDATSEADVSARACDIMRIAFESTPPSRLGLRNLGDDSTLLCRVYLHTRGGSQFVRRLGAIKPGGSASIDLDLIAAELGLSRQDLASAGILIINPASEGVVPYGLFVTE
ncbi:MAG: hypothetical protein MOGMAGMI_00923 [Candidatus Omnitrophica bacterium]|nr:hypothetical protein [Candidatus Omnitrophota bacterium]